MVLCIPTISLQGLDDPARRTRIAGEFAAAARESGFMQIVDHVVSKELRDHVFAISKQIFSLSLPEKAALRRNMATNRGYDTFGAVDLDAVTTNDAGAKVDFKEGWMIGKEIDASSSNWGKFGHGPNVLPSEEQVPDAWPILLEYHSKCLGLSRTLMSIVAASLSLPEDHFADVCHEPNAALRLLHYPSNLTGTGHGEHTDFGLLTILATNGVTGLEVFSNSAWHPVPFVPNAFIINIGDLLSLYTGGEYKSSLHRVRNVSGEERYSIPFFMDGANEVLVKPIMGGEGLVPITVEQHLRNRLDKGKQKLPVA